MARLHGNRSVILAPPTTHLEDRKQLPAWRLSCFSPIPRVVLPRPEVRAEASSPPLHRGEKRPSRGGRGAAWWQLFPSSAHPFFVPLSTPPTPPSYVPRLFAAVPTWSLHLSASHRTSAQRLPCPLPRRMAPQLNPLPSPSPRAPTRSARTLGDARAPRGPCRGGSAAVVGPGVGRHGPGALGRPSSRRRYTRGRVSK